MPSRGNSLLLALAMASAAAGQSTQPASVPAAQISPTRAADDSQRLADLLALVEAQNTPQARRTGARELLRSGMDGVPQRLAAILSSTNKQARIAVALAVSDLPQNFDPAYVDPLVAMLADGDGEVRSAAIGGLGAWRGDGLVPKLQRLLVDPATPRHGKLAALDALGRMTQRGAVDALFAALDGDEELARAALAALCEATAMSFATPADARRWWNETRDAPLAAWQQMQIERLVRQSSLAAKKVRELESRLAATLRDNFARAAEPDRAALLNSYLSDATELVRLVGVEIAQSQIHDGRPLSVETMDLLRGLLRASEKSIRAAAARAIAGVRDRSDAERMLQLLATEQDADVRDAAIYAIGYTGGSECVAPLVAIFQQERSTEHEAATALGRLAERGGLDDAAREQLAAALLTRFRSAQRDEATLRERLIRSMARTADGRFRQVMIDAMDRREPANVRIAAIRGAAALADPRADGPTPTTASASAPARDAREVVDAIAAVAVDPDAAVRRAAVEVLADVGSTDPHAQALWAHSWSPLETDEAIRAAAWRGATRLLASRTPRDLDGFIARIPEPPPARTQRALDLLRAAERSLTAVPGANGKEDLGRIRLRIARACTELSMLDEASAGYRDALRDLASARSADTTACAVELTLYALREGRYDAAAAACLTESGAQIAAEPWWAALRDELERLTQRASAGRALAACTALAAEPPPWLTQPMRDELAALSTRAASLYADVCDEQTRVAITALCADVTDQTARAAILGCGVRAAPALRDGLRQAIHSAQGPEIERLLHDLLRTILPNWPGFAPDASPADKLAAIEAAAA